MYESRTESRIEPTIRNASLSDAPRLVEIYDHYVRHTAISFEYETPGVKAFEERMRTVMRRYPYLVILCNGRIEGYAHPFIERAAYDWCCELTIYLDPNARKCGMGRLLYEALEARLREMGMLRLYACVACPRGDDPYLTCNSMDFHSHMGFNTVGRFSSCGYKFGRWYDMVWMEKVIGMPEKDQPPIVWQDCSDQNENNYTLGDR